MSATSVTSLDGFYPTSTTQRADELVRAFFDAVNAEETHMVAENDRVASRSVRDGTVTRSGRAPDFRTLDLSRIGDGSVSGYRSYIDTYPVDA